MAELEGKPGEMIYDFADRLIEEAKTLHTVAHGHFNDILLSAHPESYADDIAAIYSLKLRLARLKEICHDGT